MSRAPLRPEDRRAQVAGGLGARAHVGGQQRRRARRRHLLRRRDAALPVRRAAHGAPQELRRRRRRRALPAAHGPARAAPDRLRRVRAPGREPRDPQRRAPARLERELDRGLPARVPLLGRVVRLVARAVDDPRAELLPLDAVDLPQALRARAGLPLAGGGQLVPEGPDGAGQRAGHRRPLRALRDAGRGAPARAVVLPHHRLRRPPARRPRRRSSGPRTSCACSSNWIGRSEGAEVTFTRARDGRRLPGLHHPPGHAVRRDLLRHGARAPRRAAARRGHRARGGRPRLRQPRADREPRGPRRRRPREDRRAARPQRHQPGQRRAHPDVGGRLRADGVRHRRDHGGARPTTRATSSSRRSSSCRSAA